MRIIAAEIKILSRIRSTVNMTIIGFRGMKNIYFLHKSYGIKCEQNSIVRFLCSWFSDYKTSS